MPKQTPGQAAKAWAKVHPDFAGTLTVESLTPKGKGGRRGMAHKTTTFYVKEGQAKQTRSSWAGPGFNGVCGSCGQVFLEPVLCTGMLPDPEAGQPLPSLKSGESRVGFIAPNTVRHQKAYINACPACFERLGLDPKTDMFGSSWSDPPVDWARPHPDHCQTRPKAELDIREVEYNG